MRKQIQRLLLVAVTLVAALQSGHAHDVEVDGIYYNLDQENMTASVTYEGDSYSNSNPERCAGNISIPSSFTYEDVTYSVTSIEGYAFYDCFSLTSVTIPNSVTSIGNYAFGFCI